MGNKEDVKPLPSVADVFEYLSGEGWKIAKRTLYRHAREGKFLPRPDGAFDAKAVDKYARTWLKRLSTGKRIGEKMDELQRKKIEMEVKNLELDNARKARLEAKDAGNLVPREQLELELAAWAGILDAGFTGWIRMNAAEWVRLVGGEMGKVGELITRMSREIDEHINSYTTAEFNVIFEGEKGADVPEETEEKAAPWQTSS